MDRILILSIFVIAVYIVFKDIKTMIIPNILNLILLLCAILYRGMNYEIGIIGMGVYAIPLLFIYGYIGDFCKKDVLGFGDIKLTLNYGYILGYTDIYNVYIFYMIVFCTASIMGIYLRYRNKRDCLPFAPYLTIAFLYFFIGKLI